MHLIFGMQKLAIFLLLGVFLSFGTTSEAQRILAFDKRGKVKRVRYFEGNFIKLKLLDKSKISGTITQIGDSTFKIEGKRILLDSVKTVFNTQKLYGFNLLGRIMITAGTAYLGVDSFNRLINNEDPIVHESTIEAAGLLLGGGVVSLLISRRPYRISKRRPLKIIDITI